MSAVEQIQALIDCAVRVPLYDATGKIINPAGVDAAIEARAYRRCLKIAKEEYEPERRA